MIRNLRFFCQRVLPIVYDDSLSFQELLYKVVLKINEIVPAVNGISNDIESILKEWLEDGTIEEIINNAYSHFILSAGLLPKEVRGNVSLNIFHEDMNLQGGCCIGNNRIVVYSPAANSNIGLLECYDTQTKTLVWNENVEGYHGNTLSFDGDKTIYITACIDQTTSDNTLLNKVIKFDLDSKTVTDVIILPFTSYSTVYYKEKFYTFQGRDFTPGVDDVITVSDLTGQNIEYIILEDYIPIVGGTRTQGLSCIKDDVIYITDHNTRTIFGYDLSGTLVYSGQIEQIMNNYRWIGELEFIDQQPDNGKWFIGSVQTSTGEHLIRLGTVAEVGLYNEISIKCKKPDGVSSASPRSLDALVVVTNSKQIDPEQTYPHWVATLDDAVNLEKSFNAKGRIRIDFPEDYNGLSYVFCNYDGMVYGDINNKTPVHNFALYNCDMNINNLDFANAVAESRNINGNASDPATVFILKSKATMLNWVNAENSTLYSSEGDLMIANGAININHLTYTKLGKAASWTGSVTDSAPFDNYIFDLS